MIHNSPARSRNNLTFQRRGVMRKAARSLFLLFLIATILPFPTYAAEPTYPISTDVKTTRERTVNPKSIPGAPELLITDVSQYGPTEYSAYTLDTPGVDYGAILPDGTAVGAYNPVETLLTFFTMTDIHITDKESPAQALYGATQLGAWGNTNTSAYSPVILSTTHVLDAAVQTINALHKTTPFDFGISLGDDANSNQYNELRWFIDVMDGKRITPSTGAHKGATTIDYQKPYQSAGLDKSIPWYQAIGNHDQFWCGSLYPTDYVRSVQTGNTVIDMGFVSIGNNQYRPTFDARGTYMGVIDGTTQYGDVKYDVEADTILPPIVAPDRNRRALSTNTSTTLNWMKEFFNTTSKPKGHGFTQANLDKDFACYSFEPKASVPIKIIVLDDTCKENPLGAAADAYARGCLDQKRYDWLINELNQGQAEGKLMIVAAHIPVGPQLNVPDAPPQPDPAANPPANFPNDTPIAVFISTCNAPDSTPGVPCNSGMGIDNNLPVPPYSVVTDSSLLETLHNYSNLILWIAGHRHMNVVSPQPALAGQGPEFGFWEVETASLRDFPQGFRTFEIKRNDDNTVSIFITNVDPAVQGTGSPADKSRGYAIGAHRISAGTVLKGLTDETSHVYNAELIKPLAAPYTMTVNVTGAGSVKMGPYQTDTCTTAHACSASYLPGTQVTLAATPTPASGAVFAGWSACPGASTCTITMTQNTTVTATFTKAPTVAVTPAYKNFGTVKSGRKSTATFKVTNAATKGVTDLVIGAVTIGGTDNDQFEVVAGKDRCSGMTVVSGKSCTFQVSFVPDSVNGKSATINITSNDPATPSVTQIWGAGK